MDMKKTKRFLGLALGMMLTLLLAAGCGNEQAGGGASGGKHLNMALFWFGESVDPAHDWDGWTDTRIAAGETLVTVTDKMEFRGQLADKWENVGPTTWKFHIRENVKFQNGDDMTPDLVKASIERTLQMNTRAAKSAKIKEIRVEGQDLIVETTEPYGSLLSSLTEPAFIIIDTKADLSKADSAPVMTGPYQIVGFKKNEEIQLKKNEHYWDGAPGLDSITVKNIKDNNKRAMALQSGDLDLVQRVDAANRSLFENDKFKITESIGARVYMLNINFKGKLQDPNLRKALSYAMDYDALAKVEGNDAKGAGEPFPPSVPYGHSKVKASYNAAEAEKAFAAAGYTEKDAEGYYTKDGQPLTLKLAVWDAKSAMYEAIQDQLKKAGVKADLVRVEEPDVSDSIGDFDLLENNWVTASTNDPFWFLDQVFRSDSKSNYGHYANPEVDLLLQRMAVTFIPEEKDKLASEITETVMRDNADLFLVYPTTNVVASSKVANVTVFPIDYYLLTKDVTVK